MRQRSVFFAFKRQICILLALMQLGFPLAAFAQTHDIFPEKLIGDVTLNLVRFNARDEVTGSVESAFGFLIGRSDGVFYAATARHLLYKKDMVTVLKENMAIEVVVNPSNETKKSVGYYVRLSEELETLSRQLDVAFVRFTPELPVEFVREVLVEDASSIKQSEQLNIVGFLDYKNSPVWGPSPENGLVNTAKPSEFAPFARYFHFSGTRRIPNGTSGAPVVSPAGLAGIFLGTDNGLDRALAITSVRDLAQQAKVPWDLVNTSGSVPVSRKTRLSGWSKVGLAVGALLLGGALVSSRNGSSGDSTESGSTFIVVPTP